MNEGKRWKQVNSSILLLQQLQLVAESRVVFIMIYYIIAPLMQLLIFFGYKLTLAYIFHRKPD